MSPSNSENLKLRMERLHQAILLRKKLHKMGIEAPTIQKQLETINRKDGE